MKVVTLSATFGAGGNIVGPAVAERLGVPFIDRAIPVKVASDLGCSLDEVLARDEKVKGWLHRMLVAAAPLSTDYILSPDLPRMALRPDAEVVASTETAIRETIKERGGVILGRAGAIVLRDHPGALHVRLDGLPERRVRRAMHELEVTETRAREILEQNDQARLSYVRHFYRADATDPSLYHLLVDSTVLPLETCIDIIHAAAKAEVRPIG